MLEEIHSDRSAGVLVQEMDSTQILYALKQFGYFVMPLSEQMVNIQEESFRQYKEFDTRAIAEKAVFSLTPDAIGENNGWHAAGGLSRYNQCREGIIFQDSCEIWPLLSEDCAANPDTFSTTFESLRQSTYRFAESILEQIAIAFELPNPSSYFTEHGPLDVIGGSQFHVKKIVLDHSENLSCLRKTPEDGRYLTLRAHRDPSLISIVFHCPDLVPETCGAGLQFKDRELGTFTNIPVEQGDRAFCIVIAGSILELLTNGAVKAPLHRVITSEQELLAGDRYATTFFFQPRLECILSPFASVKEQGDADDNDESILSSTKRKMGVSGSFITYEKWKAKAYGSYYKGK